MSINNNNTAGERLVINTIIYMFGNMGSKILQMLVLPLLTAYLLTEEFGLYDLYINTISLVTPLVTFQIIEAMFRYLFEEDQQEKKVVISSVSAFLFFGILCLALIIYGIIISGLDLKHPILLYLNFITSIIFSFFQKLARSQQKNIIVAISGIINTISMIAVEAVSIIVFKMRVDGMLLAHCLSGLVASIYINCFLHIEKLFSYKNIKIKKVRELLKYSLPLVPNSICWWFISASDRYVISYFLSISSNGIYSVAGKFSQILSMLISVFQLAWQESSIIESDNKTKNEFYTNTFNNYMRLLLGGCIVMIPTIRLIMPFLVAQEYESAYLYAPILLLGAVFSAFSQFYGSAYLAFKKTNGAIVTTVIGAVINLLVDILLISKIGLFAPAFGTLLSFSAQWILRIFQMRDYFYIRIDYKALVLTLTIILLFIALYYTHSLWIHYVMFIIGLVVSFLLNKEIILRYIKRIPLLSRIL